MVRITQRFLETTEIDEKLMCFEMKVFNLINVSISVVAFLYFLPTYCITVSLMHMLPDLVSLQNKSWIFESDVNAYKTKGVSLKYKKKSNVIFMFCE